MFTFGAIKNLFASQKPREPNRARRLELDEAQLAEDRALVSLSKMLHECQQARQSIKQKLSSLWGSDEFITTAGSFDDDALVLDSDLASVCEELDAITSRERVLQSEIYFTVNSRRPRTENALERRAGLDTPPFAERLKSSVTYVWRWVAQFARGIAIKMACLCLRR